MLRLLLALLAAFNAELDAVFGVSSVDLPKALSILGYRNGASYVFIVAGFSLVALAVALIVYAVWRIRGRGRVLQFASDFVAAFAVVALNAILVWAILTLLHSPILLSLAIAITAGVLAARAYSG